VAQVVEHLPSKREAVKSWVLLILWMG
jgi:hypothetical protein